MSPHPSVFTSRSHHDHVIPAQAGIQANPHQRRFTRTRRHHCLISMLAFALTLTCAIANAAPQPDMQPIRISNDKTNFILENDHTVFNPWGFNYDHDDQGRLLEDYWLSEWPRVQDDFREMKQLGANVVRIHLQFAKFMLTPQEPNTASLDKLSDLLTLAEQTNLYLDITGLACYHKADVPPWYDALSEKARWLAQANFWQAVAARCAKSPAVFCYDLMNEPILPGADKKETDWLAGAFAGKHFVQRISLDLAGRSRKTVARQWVDHLTAAIRKHDPDTLITVGVIPWVHTFPKATPLFYSPEVSRNLDFAAVHFYPESAKIEEALTALKAYDIGIPLVIEETFPLKCSAAELQQFFDRSRPYTNGYIGFYWGKTPDQYRKEKTISAAITLAWLDLFRNNTQTFKTRSQRP